MYIPAFAKYIAETPKDVYNVEEILSQIFKTTGKMDGNISKLQEVESDEAKKTLILSWFHCYLFGWNVWARSFFP